MATQSNADQDITALARPILEDRFHNQIQILSVQTRQYPERSTMDITYRGDPAVLQPPRFKGISRRMQPQLKALGIHDPPLERYTHTSEAERNASSQTPRGQTTDGPWSELVHNPLASADVTEIDTSMPVERTEFERLADEWLEQRPRGVDVAHMTRHHSYQAIIDIGPDAAPWLLDRLAQRPDHWFHALNQITNAQPVQPQHQGIIDAMAQDWIAWGTQNLPQEQNVD